MWIPEMTVTGVISVVFFVTFFPLDAFSACDTDMSPVVHFRTKHGDTLLHAAVKSRRPEALSAFLELGCPTEALDREGRTALWLATESGEVELMKVLAKYGANLRIRHGQFNETLIHAAAKFGRDLAVFWLLEIGFTTEVKDNAEWTPLHTAAVFSHESTVRLLVARGADVNAMELNGETPLHKAARLGRHAVAEQLIELGADVNATDSAGSTPLGLASKLKYRRVVSLLQHNQAV